MKSIIVSLLALALVGCASEPPVPIQEAPGEGWIHNSLQDTAEFRTTDTKLGKLVEIDGVNTYSTHDGGLKTMCQLRNITPQPVTIQVRATFHKDDNTVVDDSTWQSFVLPPGKYIPFEASNLDGATRVLVELRLKP